MSKSKWKNQVKEKIGKSIVERTKQEMANKTKARTLVEDSGRNVKKLKCSHLVKKTVRKSGKR